MFVLRWLWRMIKWLTIFFFSSTILAVVAFRFLPVPFTPYMIVRCIDQLMNGEKVVCHHEWVPLQQIAPDMPRAAMAGEDQRFLQHHGIDFSAIEETIEYNKKHERKRGGSTITQQTAKNLFLWHGRSYLRKGLEAYFSILMELFWDKQRIMEVYLNSIEMGDGIYGVEAVAQRHFNKKAISLTRSECARIAATLPNPRKFNSKTPSLYVLKRQKWIERQMRNIPEFPLTK